MNIIDETSQESLASDWLSGLPLRTPSRAY